MHIGIACPESACASAESVAAAARTFGASHVELAAGVDGAPAIEGAARWDALGATLRESAIGVHVLRGALPAIFDEDVLRGGRSEAIAVGCDLLRLAERLGARVLVLSAMPGGAPREYSESLHRLYRRLRELVPAAEETGVRIAWSPPPGGPPGAPVEAAELIDRVNSSWVGVHVDADRQQAAPAATDWIDVLGWRLAAVSGSPAALGGDSAIAGRLRQARFSGTISVRAEPADAQKVRETLAFLGRRAGSNQPPPA